MSSVEIDYIGEGPTDDAIARRLITAAAGIPGISWGTRGLIKGKSGLDPRLKGLNARLCQGSSPILVLRDLDNDAPCAPALIKTLVSDPHKHLVLRICVRAAEAWLLADARAYSKYCGLALSKIPADPESLQNPKAAILAWVGGRGAPKLSRHFEEGDKRGVARWAALANWNRTFVDTRWCPVRAAEEGRAPSLERALHRIRTFVETGAS
jgi:hypothetical protein